MGDRPAGLKKKPAADPGGGEGVRIGRNWHTSLKAPDDFLGGWSNSTSKTAAIFKHFWVVCSKIFGALFRKISRPRPSLLRILRS